VGVKTGRGGGGGGEEVEEDGWREEEKEEEEEEEEEEKKEAVHTFIKRMISSLLYSLGAVCLCAQARKST